MWVNQIGVATLRPHPQDDEITIPELDFALKAVNYNLISDAENTYVHSVSKGLNEHCWAHYHVTVT